jgi:hypothetical protein
MFRFIHSSDLHLGKRFGNFSGDLPVRLREARHAVIARLAGHALEHGAGTVLLAGDTFDTETPAPDVRRQALTGKCGAGDRARPHRTGHRRHPVARSLHHASSRP